MYCSSFQDAAGIPPLYYYLVVYSSHLETVENQGAVQLCHRHA